MPDAEPPLHDPQTDAEPVISLRRVGKSFDHGRTHAVRGLTLDVARGELVALVGGSGSGKTTTLKIINRLIEPSEGSVIVNGIDAEHADPVALRRGIGYVFQGVGLFPHHSVAQNVAAVPRLLGWDGERTAARVEELLDLVGLPAAQYRDRRPAELSGGQRQRVGFARALAAQPELMLLDEPFGALDPVTRGSLQDEFDALRRRLGLTAVLVTHDMAEALLLADRIAVMHEGALLRVAAPAELIADPRHPVVRALVETPTRHAEQLDAIAARGRSGGRNNGHDA